MKLLLAVVCAAVLSFSTLSYAQQTIQLESVKEPFYPRKLVRFQLAATISLKGLLDNSGQLNEIGLADPNQSLEPGESNLASYAMSLARTMRFSGPIEKPIEVFVTVEYSVESAPETGEARLVEVRSPSATINAGDLLAVPTQKESPYTEIKVAEAPIFKAPGVYNMVAFKATLGSDLKLSNVQPATSVLPNQFLNRATYAISRIKFSGRLQVPEEVQVTYAWSGKKDGTYGVFSIEALERTQEVTFALTPYAATLSESAATPAAPATASPSPSPSPSPAPPKAGPPAAPAAIFDPSQLPSSLTAVELINANPAELAGIGNNSNRYLNSACLVAAYPYLFSAHYWGEVDRAIKAINDAQTGFGQRAGVVELNRDNHAQVCGDESRTATLRAALGNDVMAPRQLQRLCEIAGPKGQASYAPPQNNVMLGLGNECLDLAYLEKEEVDACMRGANRTRLRTPGLTMDEYCQCSGKLRAEYFGYGKTRISSQTLVRTASTARQVCDNVIDAEQGAKIFR